ncbi:hypothetical protein EHI44_02070 [Rhizobium leguminosarum]|uniref:hypothetical protein n=1 Tax=Rhizobium leguminosarum TaxID=384 RepID=UPI00027D7F05|nr:hypothetical protein [Rhizobium leguminosarum]RWY91845.1 hypothetical protein EHI44_02070 [Rhizobium leguminosarum]
MKKLLAGVVGFAVTLLLLAAGREIFFAFMASSAQDVFTSIFVWLGRFRWLYDFQALIAAMVALMGAWWAASAVHSQIRHADMAELARRMDKAAAGRAVLPLALSEISDYAEACTRQLRSLIEQTRNEVLPATVEVGQVPDLPVGAIQSFLNLIEVIEGKNRQALSTLIGTIQIQRSRLRSIRHRERGDGHIILRLNLERYVVDAAEIYAQAAALYDFGRKTDSPSVRPVKHSDIAAALHNMRIFDDLYDTLVERYGLASAEVWIPPFAERTD